MIPTTLLGLVFLAAGLGPGYVFLRVAERRRVSPNRSQLLEAAELVVVGAVASLAATFLLVALCQHFGWIDFNQIHHDAADYLAREPVRCLGFVLAVLLVSYGLAWVSAYVTSHGTANSIRPGDAPWNVVLGEDRGQKAAYVTVELKSGVTVAGSLRAHSSGSAEWPVVALIPPLSLRNQKGDVIEMKEDFFVASAEEIRCVTGRYFDAVASSSSE